MESSFYSGLQPPQQTHFQPRVLVVEDDLWMQPLIYGAVKSAIPNACIDWVESAEDATRKTRYTKYSIVIADIYLKPNQGTGIDLWNICRDECPEIPILLMSSIPVDTFLKKMGLYDPYYLPKPFSLVQCKEIIRNLVCHNGLTS